MAQKSITTKVTEEVKDEIDRLAEENGISVANFVRMCVEESVNRRLSDDTGQQDAEKSAGSEFSELGFDRLLRKFREKRYPDRVIGQMIGQMCDQIDESGGYNARRGGGEWGC